MNIRFFNCSEILKFFFTESGEIGIENDEQCIICTLFTDF